VTDDLRAQLAAVLIHAPAEWDEDDTAAALLPIVEAHGPASAATALRQAADAAEGMHDPPAPDCVEWADWLRARAHAAEATP
jgi:hypothetical protein